MAIDLIREYLVGIGFQVNQDSFNDAQKSMDRAEDNIKKFNDDNKKGFSDSSNTLKDLFSLFTTFGQGVGKLSPELRGPFQEMAKDIVNLGKLYNQFQEQLKNKFAVNKEPIKNNIPNTGASQGSTPNGEGETKELTNSITNLTNASKLLESEGGGAVEAFGAEAIGTLGAATAGVGVLVAALVAGAVELSKFLGGLAEQDIGYEKLSRQLWTTKENAKEVSNALDTLGVSMQDLWLSPTLLNQFNELRQDSKSLQLPKEYSDNLKTVQGISLEFARLRQLGTLAFQWIGNYILKYAAGPLNELKQTLNSVNAWLIKNIPDAAKGIGTAIGFVIRALSDIVQLFAIIIKNSPIAKIIEWLNSLPEPIKKVIKTVALLIQPIIFLLALLDDVMTYFKGGKSVTGAFFDSIKEKMSGLGAGWTDFYKRASEAFAGIAEKAKGLFAQLKEWFASIWAKAQDNIPQLKAAVNYFSGNQGQNVVPSYGTSSSVNNSATNSNNRFSQQNQNTFNVYGANDSKSTAETIANQFNKGGVFTRNFQGLTN